jgi:hypothetical protein
LANVRVRPMTTKRRVGKLCPPENEHTNSDQHSLTTRCHNVTILFKMWTSTQEDRFYRHIYWASEGISCSLVKTISYCTSENRLGMDFDVILHYGTYVHTNSFRVLHVSGIYVLC